MSPKKRRKGRPAPRHHVCRPGAPLSIASTRVIDRSEPLRLVARNADGSWQFLDGLPIDVDQVITTHAHHLFDEFPADLRVLRRLPPGYQAFRDDVDRPWRIEPYAEEE
jgi:hypothetical protein